MMLSRSARLALLIALSPPSATCQQEPVQSRGLRERFDFATPAARFDLPGRLDEISGLGVTPDGRLFGHDDERATLYEIDPATGEVGKRFSLGDPPLRGDFEGLAIVDERFFLVTSAGQLYEFREADDRAEAPYRVTDTGLGAGCEMEGLDHDPVDDVLLVPCKGSMPERGMIVVHRLRLDPALPPLPPIEIARSQLADHGVRRGFEPSSVLVDPGGSLILVSAVVEALVEVDRRGVVLSALPLSRDRHPQPEGLAFTRDGALLLADERNDGSARLTVYAQSRPSSAR
jgi:uncharacterized protein YjiK